MAKFQNAIDKSQLLWAVICIIGFGLWQFYNPGKDFFGVINIVWIILTITGLAGMFYFMKTGLKHKVVLAWAIIVVVGELLSIAMWQKITTLPLGINYGSLWALLIGIGFAYTGFYMKNRPAQYVASALCLILAGIMIAGIKPIAGLNWAFVPLGLAIGIPMIYDAWKS